VKSEHLAVKVPVVETLKHHWRAVLITIGAKFVETSTFFIFATFSISYAVGLGYARSTVLNVLLLAAFLAVPVMLFFGGLSDRIGRKWLIAVGMWVQAFGIIVIASSSRLPAFASGSVLLGVGTAMVYPTLLAGVGDVAHPSWRASAVGVYRLWRDLGYAVGAVLAGAAADALGLRTAITIVGALTFLSGTAAAVRMAETRPSSGGLLVRPVRASR